MRDLPDESPGGEAQPLWQADRVIRDNEAEMAIVLLLLDGVDEPIKLHAEASRALARLGVTRLAVLQDGATVGVLLEGWAFDATTTGRAIDAVELRNRVRVLLPVLDGSLSAPSGGTNAIRPQGGSR